MVMQGFAGAWVCVHKSMNFRGPVPWFSPTWLASDRHLP